jgi:hypothetical protein
MKHLDKQTPARLARICGMFGSNHTGERASAAAMTDSMVRQLGMTWPDVISSSTTTSSSSSTWSTASSRARPYPQNDCSDLSPEELVHIALLAEDEGLLNAWERTFVFNICGRRRLTEKQLDKLRSIVAKILRTRRAA